MITDKMAALKKTLTDNNYSLTKARMTIFTLLDSDEPQTISQIISKAKGRVDRVSIYRNIELFEKIGVVRRIYIGWKFKLELSDIFVDHHHHLTCLGCAKTIDIKDEKHIDDFIVGITDNFGFKPIRHQFEIEGLCKDCILKELSADKFYA